MLFEDTFKMGLKDIGIDNLIKNRAMLEILENIAAYHSDLVGFGANDTAKIKLTWILLDWKLEIKNRPKYGQDIKVVTWSRTANKFFTYRDFEIYSNGELVAIASSKWTLINIEKRKMTRITEDIIDKYKPEDRHVFDNPDIDKLEVPEKFTSEVEYTVIRKDIDINKHMHNLYYLDLAYEALPEDVYQEDRPFDNVRIMYKKEIMFGDTVKCQYVKEKNKHIVVIKSQDEKKLHAVIELY